MVGHYQCKTCGATMTVEGPVLDVTCPLCRFPMVPAEATGDTRADGTAIGPEPAEVPPDSESAGGVAHLKVARPVRHLDDDAAAASEPAVTAPTALEIQDQRLRKLEEMVTTACQEAELIVEAARLRARTEGERLLARFQAQAEARTAVGSAGAPTLSASVTGAAATPVAAGSDAAPDVTPRAGDGRCADRLLYWAVGLTGLYLLYVLGNWNQPAAGRIAAWSLLAADAILVGRCLVRRRRTAAVAPATVPQPRETKEK